MKKNIVLIGMPGCGKTIIGKTLYKKLEFDFVDIDRYIEEKSGKLIPELFKEGEDYFRNLEREAVNELSKEENLVISTGGGVIKNYSNIEDLKKNGVVIFIDRPVENIAQDVEVSHRPLLKDGVQKIYELFNERYEMYKKYSDFHVVNDSNIENVVEQIIDIVKLEGLVKSK